MRVYHGCATELKTPEVARSREDIDFGVGFYTTQDPLMAKKWASNKARSFVNTYDLDLSGLRVKQLKLDMEWLDYVVSNRTFGSCPKPFNDAEYDVIIGPTADDKVFVVADLYIDGMIRADDAMKVLSCVKHSDQIVLKTQDTVNRALTFIESKQLYGQEKDHFKELFMADSKRGAERAKQILFDITRGR